MYLINFTLPRNAASTLGVHHVANGARGDDCAAIPHPFMRT